MNVTWKQSQKHSKYVVALIKTHKKLYCVLLLRWLLWSAWTKAEWDESFQYRAQKKGNTKLLSHDSVPWLWCDEEPVLEAPHTNHGSIQILGLLPVGVSELTDHWLQGCWIRPIKYEVFQESGKSVYNSVVWTPNETSLRRNSLT